MPDAEIIAVGSELLTADKIDTNSLYLTGELNALGVEVRRKLVVGDDRALLSACVRQAVNECAIVIITGGLGPTEDDVTRDAVADALGRKLEFRDDLLQWLTERFKRFNRLMAENNKRQAYAIEGADALPNPRGTAPGQWIQVTETSTDVLNPRRQAGDGRDPEDGHPPVDAHQPQGAAIVPIDTSNPRREPGAAHHSQDQPHPTDAHQQQDARQPTNPPPSTVVMLLPGPPRELKGMFADECLPRLTRLLPPQVIRTRFFRVAGMGESDLDLLISPVYKPFTNPVTTILAGAGDIQIHLRARASTENEAEALLNAIAPEIERLLGDRIYSRDGSLLEAVVGQKLRALGATLSVAESCTGGILGERITSVAGSSDYFLGGFLVYSDAMKTALLGVDAHLLTQHTSVSDEAAQAMALSARERTGSTYAVSITGEAGPDSATGAPVGTVIIAIAGPDGHAKSAKYSLFGDRNGIRSRAAQWALDDLRRALK